MKCIDDCVMYSYIFSYQENKKKSIMGMYLDNVHVQIHPRIKLFFWMEGVNL